MKFLFERLSDERCMPGQADVLLREAIAANLQRIATGLRTDLVQDDPDILDLGLPCLTDWRRGQLSLERYKRRLKTLIETYEPRLRNPQISIEETGQSMAPFRFNIQAQIATPDNDAVVFPLDIFDPMVSAEEAHS